MKQVIGVWCLLHQLTSLSNSHTFHSNSPLLNTTNTITSFAFHSLSLSTCRVLFQPCSFYFLQIHQLSKCYLYFLYSIYEFHHQLTHSLFFQGFFDSCVNGCVWVYICGQLELAAWPKKHNQIGWFSYEFR